MKDNTRQDVWLFSFHFIFYKLKITMEWDCGTLGSFFVCVVNLLCVGLSINEHRTKLVGLGLSYFETSLHCAIKTTQYIGVFLQYFLTHTYLYNIFYFTHIFITLSVGLDPRLSFFFFFSFSAACISEGAKFTVHILFNTVHAMFRYCSRIVHGTHSHFIQKKILKIGLTVLFTHLKIILLQCF